MITKEAVELIQQTAVKAAGVAAEIMVAPGEPAGWYYVRNDKGVMERTAAVVVAALAAEDLDTLVRVVKDQAAETGAIYYTPGTNKGISPGATVAGLFDANCRDRVTLHAKHSEPFAKLQKWSQEGGASLTQVELYGLLRTTFHGTLPTEINLIEAIRRVDIKKVQEASGTVDRKGVSMSRSLVAEASGADRLPETFELTLPVYEGSIRVLAHVRCGLDIDAQRESFRVTVLPGQIDDALEVAAGRIDDDLAAAMAVAEVTGVPVYRGSPGA